MAFQFVVDPQRRMVLARASGDLVGSDILAFRTALAAHPDFEPEFDQLGDLSRARSAPSHGELRSYAVGDLFSAESRRAIVVADDLHFGTYRAYDSLLGDERATVTPFRTVDEACAWLGITPEEVEQAFRDAGFEDL